MTRQQKLTWPEICSFANLVAVHHELHGRDPEGREYDRLVASVLMIHRMMSGADAPVFGIAGCHRSPAPRNPFREGGYREN